MVQRKSFNDSCGIGPKVSRQSHLKHETADPVLDVLRRKLRKNEGSTLGCSLSGRHFGRGLLGSCCKTVCAA